MSVHRPSLLHAFSFLRLELRLPLQAAPIAKMGMAGGRVEHVKDAKTSHFNFTFTSSDGRAFPMRVHKEEEGKGWCECIKQAIDWGVDDYDDDE